MTAFNTETDFKPYIIIINPVEYILASMNWNDNLQDARPIKELATISQGQPKNNYQSLNSTIRYRAQLRRRLHCAFKLSKQSSRQVGSDSV